MDEINLQILNCVWDSMKGATWFSENSEFTLDYVCVNDSALKCVESAYILERGEVVESDHGAVGVNVEWKVRRKGKCRMKGKSKRKRRLTARNWESFGSQMEGRDYEDLSCMNVAMAQVDEELNEEMDNWCENRKGWVNDRVKDCIAERKSENRKYRYMRKTCGVYDVRTERQKIYMRKKEDARQEVGVALHVHNEMVMKKICEGGNKSGLYAHMKMLIE